MDSFFPDSTSPLSMLADSPIDPNPSQALLLRESKRVELTYVLEIQYKTPDV